MIVINATVLTMDGAVINNGFVQVENGIIVDIGTMDNVPCGTTYDALGGYAVPGFIDAHTHIGMNVGRGFDIPVNKDYYAVDDVDFNDIYFERAYKSGVTTVAVSPTSRCPVGGIVSVVSTCDGKVIKKDAALKLSTGENPQSEFDITEEEVMQLVTNAAKESTLPVHIHSHSLKQFDNAVLVHGTDAVGGNIFAGPMLTDISKDEMKNLSYERLLSQYESGAKIAITSDHPETPCDYLLLYAQLAARKGIPYNEALKMITSNPAEMLGIKAGKIKKGYFGGVLVFDRHPIDFYSKLLRMF